MLEDIHRWFVIYRDGTIVHQVDPDTGEKHGYEDIDREQLAAFFLYDWEADRVVIRMNFEPGQKLIWRRRVEMDGSGAVTEVCHIIGKMEVRDGKKYEGILGLFSSDERIEVTGRFEENHPWFYPVIPVKGE